MAISPEGRPVNLGEVILNGVKSKLDVTTDLQAFGLIVTAFVFNYIWPEQARIESHNSK